jgi:hypothetical protein
MKTLPATVAAALLLSACNLPTIKIGTPEPIKVDVTMRMNVYQYKGTEPTEPNAEEKTFEEAVTRQRNRMSEIQEIKANRFVGEDHRGLLHLRNKPAGEWGTYVEKTVKEENEDRMTLMRHQAKESNRALHEVQAEQWKLRSDKSFKGEWIEVPGDNSDAFKWVQAEGPKAKQTNKSKEEPVAEEKKE